MSGPSNPHLGNQDCDARGLNGAARAFFRLFPGARRSFPLVVRRNRTTRDRQFEHAATRFCASGCISLLTDFSPLITLRPRIQGTVIRPAGDPLTPGTPPSRLTQPAG